MRVFIFKNWSYKPCINYFKRFMVLCKFKTTHDIYSFPCLLVNIFYMGVPMAVLRYEYSKVFMVIFFWYNFVEHLK